ncbi:hypothetical protein [Candidatus Rhodobacter oscarellae]|nr:hypothetical protein [Candidatus Rhodobacter lobularis]
MSIGYALKLPLLLVLLLGLATAQPGLHHGAPDRDTALLDTLALLGMADDICGDAGDASHLPCEGCAAAAAPGPTGPSHEIGQTVSLLRRTLPALGPVIARAPSGRHGIRAPPTRLL